MDKNNLSKSLIYWFIITSSVNVYLPIIVILLSNGKPLANFRKDSEQTKQIEELEKQNQDLADEKERLLEEIERIIAETGNM